MNLRSILDKASTLLQGEPARAIGYGSALVVVGVIYVANALGYTRFGANMDIPTALGLTTGAILTVGAVIESIRKFVYSPATVADLLSEVGADVAIGKVAAADGDTE